MEEKQTFKVELTEEDLIQLGNLSVTLHENLDALKKVPDFEGDMSVGELLEECFFPALEHLLTQLDW